MVCLCAQFPHGERDADQLLGPGVCGLCLALQQLLDLGWHLTGGPAAGHGHLAGGADIEEDLVAVVVHSLHHPPAAAWAGGRGALAERRVAQNAASLDRAAEELLELLKASLAHPGSGNTSTVSSTGLAPGLAAHSKSCN